MARPRPLTRAAEIDCAGARNAGSSPIVARTLSFHASRVDAEAHDTPSVSFAVDADGDPSTYFGMMLEDPDVPEVRVSWGDGRDARDEQVLVLTSVALARGRFRAAFGESSEAGPYAGVEVTFDALEDDDASALAAALAALASGLGKKLSIELPGVEVGSPKKSVPDVPRRRGAPVLGLLSKQDWRVTTGGTVELALTLSNGGGPLEAGLVLEVGGAALSRGLVEPKSAASAGAEGAFERRGDLAIARLPELRLLADLDVDRNADKKAPRPPAIALTVRIAGASAGSGLLTVRALAGGRTDRAGSAMVGRTLVVEPG